MLLRVPIKHCKNCGTAVVYRVPDDGDTKQRAVCPACLDRKQVFKRLSQVITYACSTAQLRRPRALHQRPSQA